MDGERARETLLARRAELQGLARSSREAARPVELDQSRVGRVSRMDAMRSQAMSVESERRRKLELQRIGAALARLDEGDYGCCPGCGGQVAEARLRLDPAIALCIECAERAESAR